MPPKNPTMIAGSAVVPVAVESNIQNINNSNFNNVCYFYKTGYCRMKNKCKNRHIREICSNKSLCFGEKCTLRHPKPCKYFNLTGKCKFNSKCSYDHKQEVMNPTYEDLEKKVDKLECFINILKEDIEHKINQELYIIKKYIDKKFENVESLLKDKIDHKDKKESFEESNVDITVNIECKCDKCGFTSTKKDLLIDHMSKTHKVPMSSENSEISSSRKVKIPTNPNKGDVKHKSKFNKLQIGSGYFGINFEVNEGMEDEARNMRDGWNGHVESRDCSNPILEEPHKHPETIIQLNNLQVPTTTNKDTTTKQRLELEQMLRKYGDIL